MLSFVLELAALAALAVWGFTVAPNLPTRLALGPGAPIALAVIWGIWLAPASEHRIGMPWLLIAKVVVFALATAAHVAARHPRAAAVFAVLVVLNLGVDALVGQRS